MSPVSRTSEAVSIRGERGRVLALALTISLVALTYTYELRQGWDVLSTGRLTSDSPLDVDDRIAVAGVLATVVEVIRLADETRLVLEAREEPL